MAITGVTFGSGITIGSGVTANGTIITSAIAISGNDEELIPFREQLQNLLTSSLLEQRKSTIIRDVIAEQLAA